MDELLLFYSVSTYLYVLFDTTLCMIISHTNSCVGARLTINSAVTINLFLESYYNQWNIITIYIIIELLWL